MNYILLGVALSMELGLFEFTIVSIKRLMKERREHGK